MYVCINSGLFNSHRLPNKIPNTRQEKPPFELLVKGIQKIPKTMQTLLLRLKSLLLKTPCISDSGNNMSCIWPKKPAPCGLAFKAAEGVIQASKGGSQSIVLPTCDAYEPQQSVWHYKPMGAIVTCTLWQSPTALYLDSRTAQQEGNHACYWKHS